MLQSEFFTISGLIRLPLFQVKIYAIEVVFYQDHIIMHTI